MPRLKSLAVLALFASGFAAQPALAEDFGDLTCEFLFKGEPPKLPALATQNADCTKFPNPDETLVVNPTTKGIANIVVYLKKKPKSIHPDLQAVPGPVNVNQKGCQFVPHVVMVRTKQTMDLTSGDTFAHNTKGAAFENSDFNILISPMGKSTHSFEKAESTPVKVECNIHGHMNGHWLVIDHPYGGISDENGKVKIEKLPVGKHDLVIWQERVGYIEKKLEVTIDKSKPFEIKKERTDADLTKKKK